MAAGEGPGIAGIELTTYRQIFKSTALVGGAQVVNIAVGIVRTKVLALLLGPSGMGLVGLYSTATQLIGTVTGMGIGASGVRQIAEAAGANDEVRIARTVTTLRRVAFASGSLGMLTVLALCVPLSRLSFGDSKHVAGMALISLTLLFGSISEGQLALLQGLRRLKDLAATQVIGAVIGTVASITVVYLLRERGVAPYLVVVSAFAILTSWWFARRVRVSPVSMTFRETVRESRALLGMGTAFMVACLLAAAVAFLSRVLITRSLGMEAVGLYQATWTLSTLYVGLVMNAMGMDYYPRLTAAAHDDDAVNRMVNEQTEMGLLIALPGVLATITLAPWILELFYSREFVAASSVIRWQIVGIALRVASWPLGFVQLAKGRAALFVLTEVLAHSLHMLLIFTGLRLFGLIGVGIAFALLYVAYTVGMLFVCRSLSGFLWSRAAGRIFLFSCAVVAFVFLSATFLPRMAGLCCGLLMTAVTGVLCLRGLQNRLGGSLWGLLMGKLRRGSAT